MGIAGQIAGFVVIAAMAALVMTRAALRARHSTEADSSERAMRVYRDQLKEIERDLARGTISDAEAERLRLEVSRRILDLDRQQGLRTPGRLAPKPARAVLLGLMVAVLLGGAGLYFLAGAPGYGDMPLAQRHAEAERARVERPRQLALEAEYAAAMPQQPRDFQGRAELEPMVEQLRAALVGRPEDATGFSLLAQNEARLGNLRAAIEAQEHVIALRGDQASADDYAFLLDLMVLAAGGMVSPEAEQVIEQVLRRDASNGVALYYTGRMYAQTGRPDMTFRIWRRLHDISAGDAPWMPEIRDALPELARISGEPRYQLPPRPAPAGAAAPSDIDLDAAQEMTPEERAEMIEGMVASLSARLGNEGGSAEEWAQLIRALAVLERTEQALDILNEARMVFAARAADLALINRIAEDAGLRSGMGAP